MDNMDKSTTQQEMPKPHRGKTTSSTDTSDLTTDIEVSVLASINKKLDLLGAQHNKIKNLLSSLKCMHNYIEENKTMKETISNIQTSSMPDKTSFSGITQLKLQDLYLYTT